MADSPSELTVYVWPGKWNLSSIQPESLAVLFALQLTIPGKFTVKYCSNPDLSPTGQLPCVESDGAYVSTVQSIFSLINQLEPQNGRPEEDRQGSSGLDAFLTLKQASQKAAWIAYTQAHLGDLVAYTFFSSSQNYQNLTRPAISELLPFPQNFFVPDRIRDSYRPRLESADLWLVAGEESESVAKEIGTTLSFSREKLEKRQKHRKAIAKEKIIDHVKNSLDVLKRALGTNPFFFGEYASTLDTLIAAHILLLRNPPFPDKVVPGFINESYPSLLQHAKRVFDVVMDPDSTTLKVIPIESSWSTIVHSLTPKWPWLGESGVKLTKTDDERRYDRLRWGWYALAGLSVIAWLTAGSVVVLNLPEDQEDDDAGNLEVGEAEEDESDQEEDSAESDEDDQEE